MFHILVHISSTQWHLIVVVVVVVVVKDPSDHSKRQGGSAVIKIKQTTQSPQAQRDTRKFRIPRRRARNTARSALVVVWIDDASCCGSGNSSNITNHKHNNNKDKDDIPN